MTIDNQKIILFLKSFINMSVFPLKFTDVLDILLVAIFIYYLLKWLRGTVAVQLLRGFVFVLIIYILSQRLHLVTLDWILERFTPFALVIIAIVFQPEIRRALVALGRSKFFGNTFYSGNDPAFTIKPIVKATMEMSKNKIGALIVIEKNIGLNEFIETGVKINASLSSDLLLSIFNPASVLHDGAVIIQNDRISAASCLLPLSTSRPKGDNNLGTRHHAAIGISEQTDALVVVVSERIGSISLADDGELTTYLDQESLENKLYSALDIKRHK